MEVSSARLVLEPFNDKDSVRLLAKLIGRRHAINEAQVLHRLSSSCSGFPLALSIIGARIGIESLDSLGDLVSQFDGLTNLNTFDLQDESISIRAAFELSYSHLSAQVKRTFAIIGVHISAEFDISVVAAMTGFSTSATRRFIHELCSANLLQQIHPSNYRIHDVLRSFANEKAQRDFKSSELRDIIHQMLEHYLHGALEAAELFDPQRVRIDVPAPNAEIFLPELHTYADALRWFEQRRIALISSVKVANSNGQFQHVWQLSWALADYLDRSGHWDDWVSVQQDAVTAAKQLGDHVIEARIHRQLAWALLALRETDRAVQHTQEAISLSLLGHDQAGEGHGRHLLAWAMSERGDLKQATQEGKLALGIYKSLDLTTAQADALNNLAWYSLNLRDEEHAADYARQALALYREMKNKHGEALALDTLAGVDVILERHPEAIAGYQRSLLLHKELADHYYQARVLMHLADAYESAGVIREAIECLERSIEILRRLRHSDQSSASEKLLRLTDNLEE